MTLATAALLLGAGLGAGFIDAIAGGGGLISVPALLAAGLPPQIALGTNKMQSTWGTLLAVRRYMQAGLVQISEIKLAVAVTFVFAMLGTLVVTQVSNDVLKQIVPWLLLGVAAYALFSPRLGRQPVQARMTLPVFSCLGGAALGFYDGFFGPGTGSFWTVGCVALLGLELTRATAFTKVVNLTSNIASLIVFIVLMKVRYDVAAIMIEGQLIGARLGSGLVIRHGAPFVRIVFLMVVFAMVAKLFWDQWLAGS